MKKLLLICSALLVFSQWVSAQVTSISVEPVYTDDGTIAGYPAGHTTYRIYANLTHVSDRLTAVFGDESHPMSITVTGNGIWNYAQGGATAASISCDAVMNEELEAYDSYLTIGSTCHDEFTTDLEALEDPEATTWIEENFNNAPYGLGQITVNSAVGGVWFNLPTHSITQAGESQRVLLAQITTNGSVCGTINIQVFPEYSGPGSDYIEQYGISFSVVPGMEVAAIVTSPHCPGDENGSIQVEATGGNGELSYSLDNAEYVEFGQWNNLAPGNYTVYIKDEIGCVVVEEVAITAPQPIEATYVATDITCNGAADGEIHISATGGAGMTIFSLDGENYLPAPDFTNLGPGSYHIHIMDMYACTYIAPEAIVFTDPEPIVASLEYEIITCYGANDGEIHITIEGGEAPYEFHYGNFSTSANPILNVAPGSYVVTVTDARGCVYTIEDWALIGEPTPVVVSGLEPIHISEGTPGGNTNYTVTGGIFPYTFSWVDPNGVEVSTDQNLPQLFGAVAAGTYTLTITDDNGCVYTTSIDVSYLVGIEEQMTGAQLAMYPNPTYGEVQLEIVTTEAVELEYRIVDASGRVIGAPRTIMTVPGKYVESLNLSHLASGIYFVELKSQKENGIYRFIKM